MSRPDSKGIQVLARASRLLRALDGEPQGLSLSELAERIELPRSTVHRLVTALATEGFVVPASPNGRVRLGQELIRLAEGGRRDLQADFRPAMQQLFDELNETVDLAVLERDHLRFIDQINAPHRLRAVSAVGALFPLHCTANGKAALSLLDEPSVRALLPARLPRHTEKTITQRRRLLLELEEIRKAGVAFDREEHTIGICAAGFAIRTADGAVAAISVPMPTSRFSGREAELANALRRTRAELLAVFGDG